MKWPLVRNFQPPSYVRNLNTTRNPHGTALPRPLGPGNPRKDVVAFIIKSDKDAMRLVHQNEHRSGEGLRYRKGIAASFYLTLGDS